MKIDRLVSIISVLLQKEKVTTTYLAEKFEVSKRTILRDIDSLNKAGIPIVTTQGNGGGVSIMDNYKLDKCIGKPTDEKNSFFLDIFRERFYPAYKMYSGLETEFLMEFTPTLIYKWNYENSIPYMEYWYFNEQKYVKKYIGELNEKQISQTDFT